MHFAQVYTFIFQRYRCAMGADMGADMAADDMMNLRHGSQLRFRWGVEGDYLAVERINRLSLPGVSRLDPAEFQVLCKLCCYFRVGEIDGEIVGYLFAMDRAATSYDGEEFQWFCQHVASAFLYIDQIAVTPDWRGQGLAAAFYRDLAQFAHALSVGQLVCEINKVPPNVPSLRFHEAQGFSEVGDMDTRGVTVSLRAKVLPSA